MMLLSNQLESIVSSSFDTDFGQIAIRYRGWSIVTKSLNGMLWLHWQHPQESFYRYGCPVTEAGITSKISYVKSLIDLAIELEQEVPEENETAGMRISTQRAA